MNTKKISAVRKPSGKSLIKQIEEMLDKKLDQRFGVVDQKFAAVDQGFVTMNQRFAAVDQKLAAMNQRFTTTDQGFATMDKKISALQLAMFDTKERLSTLTEDVAGIRVTLDHHTNALDGISHQMSKWDTEFPIMSHVVLGLDRWATAAGAKIGVRYVRDERKAS